MGKNNGVGCHALLQGIFLTQGSNESPVSPALQVDSLPTETPGKGRDFRKPERSRLSSS